MPCWIRWLHWSVSLEEEVAALVAAQAPVTRTSDPRPALRWALILRKLRVTETPAVLGSGPVWLMQQKRARLLAQAP